MNSVCGLNVVKVSCCGLCAMMERLEVGDADSHEHYITLTLPHICGPHQTSSEDLEVLCKKFSNSVVIPTFVAKVQLFSFLRAGKRRLG